MSRCRLYVGNLSRDARTSDVEYIFGKYGRIVDMDLKSDFGFIEFDDPRDADDAIYELDGYRLEGSRLTVERARSRGPRDRGYDRYDDRGYGRDRDPRGRDARQPGSGKCFNCGKEGHWARDCQAGDWRNRCYRCGERGHIERECTGEPRKTSRSASPRRRSSRSASPVARRESTSRSRSRSRSRSPSSAGSRYNEDKTTEPVTESVEPAPAVEPDTVVDAPAPVEESAPAEAPAPAEAQDESVPQENGE